MGLKQTLGITDRPRAQFCFTQLMRLVIHFVKDSAVNIGAFRIDSFVPWLVRRPAYLGGDGGEAVAEVHVLMDLAAIGGQKPVPEGLAFAHRLVAVALVGQELRHVPVVCRCSSN